MGRTNPWKRAKRGVRRRLLKALHAEPIKPEKLTFTPAEPAAKPRKRPPPSGTDPRAQCLVCGPKHVVPETLSGPIKPDMPATLTALCCQRCRYVHLPENHREYEAATDVTALGGGRGKRMGTWEEPGREYNMAKLGLEVLRRDNSAVLMYGVGQSIDCHHAAKHPRAGRVAIGDLAKLRNDAEFIDTSKLGSNDFDVVVASEVLEHLPDPYVNFENLFSYVNDNGIVICGTNIRDGLPIQKVGYVWVPGHVSYWSPKSLRIVAKHFDMNLDFRVPRVSTGYAGPRKRYVIFSRSRDVMDSVADWFGSHMYAPSDRPDATRHENPAEIPTGPPA